MNLKQLSWFVELVKSSNFTKAAKNLYIDQSTLSKGIKAMEEDIGVPLIDRGGKRLQAYATGRDFVSTGRRNLNQYLWQA